MSNTHMTGTRANAQTWWLVGASEGLGEALARKMGARGDRVILSARNADKLAALAAEIPGATALPCDVASTASVRDAAARLPEIDGVIFLAGVYWPMKAQDWNAEQAETMVDVNLTGAFRVLGQVVPGMVARGRGRIVLTGSLAGYRGLPGAIGYGASKAGLMHLAETMHADLRGTGVRVQQLNPGFIRTRLTAKNDFSMPFIMEPEAAADTMLRLIDSGRFKAAFPTVFGLVFRIGQLLPDWLYYRLFAPRP